MSAGGGSLIRMIGRLVLGLAGILLLLLLANRRSRFYYHGPNYSFLLWLFLYCAVTGVGLLKHRKWAILSLFVPGILTALIFVYATWAKGAHVPMPWAAVNYGFITVLFVVPSLMLRYWHELRW